MMKVVRNPSMQMEKFDRTVRSVNWYDNDLNEVSLSVAFKRHLINNLILFLIKFNKVAECKSLYVFAPF